MLKHYFSLINALVHSNIFQDCTYIKFCYRVYTVYYHHNNKNAESHVVGVNIARKIAAAMKMKPPTFFLR